MSGEQDTTAEGLRQLGRLPMSDTMRELTHTADHFAEEALTATFNRGEKLRATERSFQEYARKSLAQARAALRTFRRQERA